jgi:F0F1-type ATP synthase assembly protein I
MPGKQTQRGEAARAYSLGFELVCAVAGFTLVGIWIDRHFSCGPWGTLIGLLLGAVGGFYNLFRGTLRTRHTDRE